MALSPTPQLLSPLNRTASYNSAISGVQTGQPIKAIAPNPISGGTPIKVDQYGPKVLPTPTASPAATSTIPATIDAPKSNSPAAQQYVQNQVSATTNQPAPGATNDIRDSSGQLVNPIGAQFDRNTGQPINQSPVQTGVGTPGAVQIDPTTGAPLNQSPTDQAYQTYLQSLQPNAAVQNSQKALNDFQLAEKKNQIDIGNQNIPIGFITGQQQAAAQNNAAQEANLQGNVGIAQNAQQQVQQAAQEGLTYQENQQQLNKPIQVSPGSQLINPITGEVISGGANGTGGAALTPEATNFISQVSSSGVNLDGLLPSLGNGAAGSLVKQNILNDISQNAAKLGIDGGTFAAMLTDSRAKASTYSALQKQGSQTKVNEDTAIQNFNQLQGLADKVANDPTLIQSSIPVLQNWLLNGQLALTGNPNVNNFMGTLTTALTEYAKVVSGATTGSAVTDSANGAAQKLLNAGLSPSTIASFIANAKQEMSNRTSSYDDALKGLFGNIQSLTDTSGGLGTSTSTTSSGSGSIYDF